MTNLEALTRCLQALDYAERERLYRSVISYNMPVLCGSDARLFKMGTACCPATYAAYDNPFAKLGTGNISNVKDYREIRNTYSKLTTTSHSLGFGDFGDLLGKLSVNDVRVAIRAARG